MNQISNLNLKVSSRKEWDQEVATTASTPVVLRKARLLKGRIINNRKTVKP